ncbi:hypothetical protein G7Y89_g9970 [Cudoniella acicularis]|uniref:F-box domain-containing protein n=1 Tax=Cudoniella acicularis TaxID=354080 RepID=A0A8H4VZM5_9HELO|nr:hypothetical protein G7Y89_g9970 [Cudoniella acicularis]
MSQQSLQSPQSPKYLQLDDLPVEIIRRIAANGPFTSALSLRRVNRSLHRACSDWTVFRGVIENNGNGRHGQFCSSPFCAFAFQYITQGDPLPLAPFTKQLIQAHYPGAREIGVATWFCLAASSISTHLSPENNEARIKFYLDLREDPEEASDELDLDLNLNISIIPWIANMNEPLGFSRGHVPDRYCPITVVLPIAYRALSVLHPEISLAIAKGTISKHTYTMIQIPVPATLPIPPSAFDIPFASFMKIPAPLSPDCVEQFGKCHLPAMTAPSFLESGTWTGYLCGSLDAPFKTTPTWNAPMRDLTFTTTAQEEDSNILNFRSNNSHLGVFGSFHLKGQMWRDSGKMNLVVSWDSEPQKFFFQAVMCPFGIIGSFGESTDGLWMWFWKSEWTGGKEVEW